MARENWTAEWDDVPTVDIVTGVRRRRPLTAPAAPPPEAWVELHPCVALALHGVRDVLEPRLHVVFQLADRLEVPGAERPVRALLEWMLLDADVVAGGPETLLVTRRHGSRAEIEVRVHARRTGAATRRRAQSRQLASALGGVVTITRDDQAVSYLLALPARPTHGRNS